YDIYGGLRDLKGEKSFIPFRQLGQYEDLELEGLYYNRFRYYDCTIGNYISQDPIGLAGGNPTLYGYVHDSNKQIDPFGLNECTRVKPEVHFHGTEKPRITGATPNSVYSHIDPKSGKVVQNAIYDANGNVVGHVDFKNHGIESGHWHEFPVPGNPASGHGAGKPHHPNSTVPDGWDVIPSGIQPHTPIGT
ncbi:RHS repeat-associated core domain-containing protein, partial [Flavobacterium davisii]|uniref:RHS repeat-associated core domain-containing protein n=1 Tax=Flavobacterium davisii TaxID=2906077 RepID=UPI002936E7BE